MKLTLFVVLFSFFGSVASETYSQTTRLSLDLKNEKVVSVLESIEDQSNFFFVYSEKMIDVNRIVDITVKDVPVDKILDEVFDGTNVSFMVRGRQIVLSSPDGNTLFTNQSKSISGKVSDSSGASLPGVTVVVKGTTRGTITDVDGRYSLSDVPNDGTLQFSFVGMKMQEVPVSGKSFIDVIMEEESIGLDEVIAIGYGTMKKSDLTGSVGSVKSENLVSKGSTSVMEGLQGQVAGVNIQQVSSRSGDGFNIQIRGKSSMQGGEPLYVIDGVVCDNMNFLNPMDIEKIDVLKDASSTAIYGSRATNGVLMITTKKGTEISETIKTNVSYDGYYGVRKSGYMPDFMDGDQFLRYRFSRYLSSSQDATTGSTDWNMTDANFRNFWNADSPVVKQIYADKNYTNWQDIVLRDGQQQNHFVNIAGNSRDISYRVGIGYQAEDGILYDGYERWNIKASLDSKINDQLKVGFNTNMATSLQERGSLNSVLTGFKMTPVMPAYYWEGDNVGEPILQPGKDVAIYPNGGGPTSMTNPIIDRMNSTHDVRSYYVMANTYLQYAPVKDIILKTTFSPMYTKNHNGMFYGVNTENRRGKTNYAEDNSDEVFSYTWDNQVNYLKKFGDHNFNLLGLVSVYSKKMTGNNMTVVDMPFDVNWYNLSSGTVQNQGSYYEKITMLSYVTRLNYDYKGRYLATISSRWDGSSKFKKENRWGMFPSAALAWRMSEESFLEATDWLTNLKLRVSYGVTGNNALVGPYDTQSLADTKYYYNYGSTVANGYGYSFTNPDLTWEKTNEINAGLDFGLWNNRVYGSIDVYHKISKDLLMEMDTPYELGSSTGSIWSNVGKVKNSGIEAQLTTVNVKKKEFTWTTSFTFAHNKNEILELNGGKEDLTGNWWFIGQPIDVVYGYVLDGVCTAEEAAAIARDANQKTKFYEGEMKIKDTDGSGTIDPNDKTIQGHVDPSWTGSLSSNVNYKNFDFSFSVYTSQGSKVYSPFMLAFASFTSRGQQRLNMNYYIPDGAPVLGADGEIASQNGTHYGSYPFPTGGADNAGAGSFWLNSDQGSQYFVDNSYVKVKNIVLGYTIPKKIISKIMMANCRVYLNVLNPFTFTNYKGFDPEWADASISDGAGGVSSKTYQIGVNVKF
ncbi:TonB-dependent receptor [uncultured Sunxiuqinia sp.]|uniref:TonB-dependent receptor n=1 Tax=uncultured Sunxiuqinia sp. TaxID=1573825 RepID=UPI002AA5ECFA|nr:TonB-dependent receptor [uncultured Sunxiuqinia sp.]